MSDFLQGIAVGSCLTFLMSSFIATKLISAHKRELIELGVGEYYFDSEYEKQFRTLEPKEFEIKEQD